MFHLLSYVMINVWNTIEWQVWRRRVAHQSRFLSTSILKKSELMDVIIHAFCYHRRNELLLIGVTSWLCLFSCAGSLNTCRTTAGWSNIPATRSSRPSVTWPSPWARTPITTSGSQRDATTRRCGLSSRTPSTAETVRRYATLDKTRSGDADNERSVLYHRDAEFSILIGPKVSIKF